MGGTKNRDAKMKANKVFASGGGGGGTKGPATIDKRGQEVKCPYCDKIYQQSGRLKEHIASKHADQLQPADAPSTSAPVAAAPATAAAAPGPARPNAKGADGAAKGGPPGKDPAVAAAAAAAARAAAQAAAASTSGGAAGAGAAGAAGGGAAGGVMTLQSRAGYYTSKSPSMHLHEWIQKEKRVRARFVPKRLENGMWTCKVVLPDGKRQEDDVVIFLDDAHAAADEAEARERGAVAALNRVMGDRALERILPRDYVPLWNALGEERKRREEAATARRAADERRKAAEEARRKRSNVRAPQTVVMSAAKQRLVQSLLRDRDLDLARAGAAGAGGADGGSAAELADVVEALSGMGFSPQHVQLAYERRAGAAEGAEGGAASAEALLDWLLLNLPSDQLPGQFTKGSATNMVNVVARADPSRATGVSLASVARLMAYGYSSAEAEAALAAAGGDEAAAHVAAYGRLTDVELGGGGGGGPAAAAVVAEGDADAWAEELMVLESIYDTAFAVLSENAVRLTLELPDTCPVATRSDAPLVLEFVRVGSTAAGGLSYPAAPPLVGVSCSGLAAGGLRHLTRVLAAESQALAAAAEPALHTLAARALEEAAEMDEQTCAAAEAGAGGRKAGAGAGAADGAGGDEADESLVAGFEDLMVDEEEEDDDDVDGGGEARRRSAAARAARRPEQQMRRRRPQIDIAAESARLARVQSDLDGGGAHAGMRSARRSLPAFAKRGEVLAALAAHDVVVVSGATGCGKSTQVPQYILEDAIAGGAGAACNIIVTQPRRISALGLANRVAAERGEGVGATVGYSVRLEHKSSAATRLTFVTTGILLRRLLSDPDLEGTTHIVLDEVHERSIEIDLLLLLLRDVLARRRQKAAATAGGAGQQQQQQQLQPLKLVLMSATADAQLFAEYMTPGGRGGAKGGKSRAAGGGGGSSSGEVGVLTIPGFTYPVREFYLEDALELTGHVIGRDNRCAKRGLRDWKDAKELPEVAGRPLSGALGPGGYSDLTLRSLYMADEEQINYDLLVDVIAEIIARHKRDGSAAFMTDWPQAYASGRGDTSGGGAILVFLPGAPEIGRLQRLLLASDKVLGAAGGRGGLRVLPLHGSLSSGDQSKVFARPPPGCYKVVLSTNVAETSITIDDVTVVVDAGRAKEMSHDAERGIQRLQEGWVSKAAAQQRRGRAGRVRPGVCFRLFSTEQWQRMPQHTEPEMLRSPLESVALLIKGMMSGAGGAGGGAARAAAAEAAGGVSGEGGVAAFLGRCLSPPSANAVNSAVHLLRTMGAFDGREGLTSLGRHLARMPMDPRVGKALVYGALLGCLEPVLTVTAALAHGRPVFLNLQSAGEGVAEARRQLLRAAVDSRSDHIALVAAYNAWCRATDKGGRSAASSLCADCGLSESSLEAIQAGRAEYARVLAELGFLSGGGALDARRDLGPAASLPGSEWLSGQPANRNAGNGRFLKAALCAGFYPSVLRVDHPRAKFVEVHGGTAEADADPKDIKFFDRERGRVFIHPGSLLFAAGKFPSGWLVYTQMTETSKLFVREASMVPVYALLLFGGEVAVDHAAGRLRVDGWAEFKAAANVGVMVRELRSEMDRLLGAKIQDPELDLGSNKIVAAVEELLSTDGF